jgi:hypothetical protein
MRVHLLTLTLLPFLTVAAAAQLAPKSALTPQVNLTTPHDSRTELPAIGLKTHPVEAPKVARLEIPKITKLVAPNNSVCYTVRSYQFTADPAPKPSGQTTCSPAHTSSALIVVQPK